MNWDYKVSIGNDWSAEEASKHLTSFGDFGWELVAVLHRPSGPPFLYFKRPLSAATEKNPFGGHVPRFEKPKTLNEDLNETIVKEVYSP